jgi:ABC-type phosphate transport system substrate-binding protein
LRPLRVRVKTFRVKFPWPDSKQYPYSRSTFYYTNGEPAGLVKDFVEFTLSEAGQKIVANVGFVPVK